MNLSWLIFLIPYGAFLVIGLIIRPFFKDRPKISGYICILAIELQSNPPPTQSTLPSLDVSLLSRSHRTRTLQPDTRFYGYRYSALNLQ